MASFSLKFNKKQAFKLVILGTGTSLFLTSSVKAVELTGSAGVAAAPEDTNEMAAPALKPTPKGRMELALKVGSTREIEGDVTCAKGTGGILVYAETKNYRVYICSDEKDPTRPRFYRSFNKDGSRGLNIEAVDYNPRQMRYFEFKNKGYTYILQIPTSQIPDPVLGIELPSGKRYEEKVLRYLTRRS